MAINSANYGTLQLLDELVASDNDNIYEYGEDAINEHVTDIVAVHNELTRDILDTFCMQTTNRISRFGADAVTGSMVEVDEYGLADVQKAAVAGYDIGVPLKAYQFSVGWTKRYFETHTVGDMSATLAAVQAADIRNLKLQLVSALFRATNYTFSDHLVDQIDLPIKALQNADGTPIPIDEYGDTFNGATHTHLVGRVGGSLAASDITALIDNVAEHGTNGGQVIVYINEAQLSAITAFSSNFDGFQAPLVDPGPGSTADIVAGGRKDNPYDINDKPVGIWNGYVWIWVKPWMPANYIMAFLTNPSPRGKVLRMRKRGTNGYGDLRMVSDHEHHPLRAQTFEREFGISVWNRLGAAILYIGGTSYVQPTLTA